MVEDECSLVRKKKIEIRNNLHARFNIGGNGRNDLTFRFAELGFFGLATNTFVTTPFLKQLPSSAGVQFFLFLGFRLPLRTKWMKLDFPCMPPYLMATFLVTSCV